VLVDPVDQLAGVALVGPDVQQRRLLALEVGQQRVGGVAVLDLGAGDVREQQEAVGVDRRVPLAPPCPWSSPTGCR
jgi:hypothetical protein